MIYGFLPLVIGSNFYDSVKLAIQIQSSALAVRANIISYTLKAATIAEQEPPGLPLPAHRVNNAELIKKLSCMVGEGEIHLMTDLAANGRLIWQVIHTRRLIFGIEREKHLPVKSCSTESYLHMSNL